MAIPQKIVSLPSQTIQLLTLIDPGKRVSDVIKELIENSVDAGSSEISIYIESGGYSLIKIVDNGCGILKECLPDVCRYHSTSKIRNSSDIKKLESFGFRGSSLAHFSCFSKVLVTTKTQSDEDAFCCSYLYNVPIKTSKCESSMLKGTVVELKDLLYNYPEVRMNRKKDSAEQLKILHVVLKYAFIFPHIKFLVYSNPEYTPQNISLMLKTEKSSEEANILNLLKPQGDDAFIKVTSDSFPDTKLVLYLSNFMTEFHIPTRGIYLNQRLISCPPIKAAVDEIYNQYKRKNKIPTTSKPSYFILITIPNDKIDIQRHYSRKRVTFQDQLTLIEHIKLIVNNDLAYLEDSKSQGNISQGTTYTSIPSAATSQSSTQTQLPSIPITSSLNQQETQIKKLQSTPVTINQENISKSDLKNKTEQNISKQPNPNSDFIISSYTNNPPPIRRVISENNRASSTSSLPQTNKAVSNQSISSNTLFQPHSSSQIPNSSATSPNPPKLPQRVLTNKLKSHIIPKNDDSSILNTASSGTQQIMQSTANKFRYLPVNAGSQSQQQQQQQSQQPQQPIISNQQARRKQSPQQQQPPQPQLYQNQQQRRPPQPQTQIISNQSQRQVQLISNQQPSQSQQQHSIQSRYSNNLSQQQQDPNMSLRKKKIKTGENRNESPVQQSHQTVIQSSSLHSSQSQSQKHNNHHKNRHIQSNQNQTNKQSQQQQQQQQQTKQQPQTSVQISQNSQNSINFFPIYPFLNSMNIHRIDIYPQQQQQQQQQPQSQQQQHSLMNSHPHTQHTQNQQQSSGGGSFGLGNKSSGGNEINKKKKRKEYNQDPDYVPP